MPDIKDEPSNLSKAVILASAVGVAVSLTGAAFGVSWLQGHSKKTDPSPTSELGLQKEKTAAELFFANKISIPSVTMASNSHADFEVTLLTSEDITAANPGLGKVASLAVKVASTLELKNETVVSIAPENAFSFEAIISELPQGLEGKDGNVTVKTWDPRMNKFQASTLVTDAIVRLGLPKTANK